LTICGTDRVGMQHIMWHEDAGHGEDMDGSDAIIYRGTVVPVSYCGSQPDTPSGTAEDAFAFFVV
jgi:hypothetical protein